MIRIAEVTTLHATMVARWHQRAIDNPYQGFLAAVCTQLSFNYQLWHEEDIARSREVSDARIAEVKRAIDKFNQQRNDWIEKLDDMITAEVDRVGIRPGAHATLNTETPGSSIDRLSILALRIYHLKEQRDRLDATAEHVEGVERKLAIALAQHDDLSASAQQLIDDIFAGRKKHKTYRQLKMYNDPSLNPYLYQARRAA
ncbi:conserved hypothetical protein [Pirellula staleyi DSM 6068]|uniref:DUF4254 domain-containing protein n=1 Tax=Pirellula staleyi (strain ATCC 27377 / DSM 6068 / ICPB 4128) TaxID=530564 RepID=D2R031_PIRSD|nr:DUF4254 domain-containing protein [Pirellula staleyi]ADB18396.1 conserved hypothetical protein [Pirellula staleyi DSM 6068]